MNTQKLRITALFSVVFLLLAVSLQVTAQNPIVHSVTVGGHNAVLSDYHQGAGFSLVAKEFADGTLQGQWQGKFAPYLHGFHYHATITCLSVNGNEAWITGMINNSSFPGVIGSYVIVRVKDNGNPNHDHPDQVSIPYIDHDPIYNHCDLQFHLPLWDMTEGQVKVR